MSWIRRIWFGGMLVSAALGLTVPAAAEDPVIHEVLEILRDRGIVDEARYSELVSKNERYEEEHRGLLGRIEFSGDMRGRFEHFWYDDTALDEDRPNRTRVRYRVRLQGKAKVNDYVDAVFRLASGESDFDGFPVGDRRSTNRTLGRDNDFGNDEIFIDLAFLHLKAPSHWLGESTEASLDFGKVPNPFRWKKGKDLMLWDSDITPEGVAFRLQNDYSEQVRFFLNSGYFILDENSTSKDPHVLGIQGGVELAAAEDVSLGARLSWYNWRSLNSGFFGRAFATGSVADGLTDGAPTGSNDGISAGELAAYVAYEGIEDWPILLYGHYARNFDAKSSDLFPAPDDEDTGWGIGLELGSKKKVVMLGAAYYRLEANFWPAQFTDSNLFDGRTNGEGWTLYGSRQILPNTDLNVTLFVTEPLRETVPDFANSVRLADRVRLQTDLVVKF